ncbi:MAG: stage V sporulation protein AD [Firmicutes bacterium]|nr:stage V sporulation protein AD [Bacillota bacterium]
MKQLGKYTKVFKSKPLISAAFSIVGPSEAKGPLKAYFDYTLKDDTWGTKTYEQTEQKMQQFAIDSVIEKAGLQKGDIDTIFAGDLLNQIISSGYTARAFDSAFVGLYGACSTFALALIQAAIYLDGGFADTVVCATSSHYSSAERQFRFPLELGVQPTPAAQNTVTGAGAVVVSAGGAGNTKTKPVVKNTQVGSQVNNQAGNQTNNQATNQVAITMATIGKVIDYGITDVNNMGAAMAPAALSTLETHFSATNTQPSDYCAILTGDLGEVGKKILIELAKEKDIDLSHNYQDCGVMIYNTRGKKIVGGSGAGCCAVVFSSYVIKRMLAEDISDTKGDTIGDTTANEAQSKMAETQKEQNNTQNKKPLKKVLFVPTGALHSPTSALQGASIPCIAHAVVLERV